MYIEAKMFSEFCFCCFNVSCPMISERDFNYDFHRNKGYIKTNILSLRAQINNPALYKCRTIFLHLFKSLCAIKIRLKISGS